MFLYTMGTVQEGTTSKIDISNWNTSNVRDMSGLFGLYRGNEIIIKGINTTNVTNMKGMFATFSKYLTSLDLSGISTENVTDMSWMFAGTRSLTTLDLSNFNTSKVTDMSSMFYGLSSLTALDVSHFKTSKVTNMSAMFAGLDMQELNLSSFDTSNVTNMGLMFSGCVNLKDVTWGNNWASNSVITSFDASPSPLSHDSCLDLFNKLATKSSNATLQLSTTTKGYMSEEEIAIATNKGWTVS